MTAEKTGPAYPASGDSGTWELLLFVTGDSPKNNQIYNRLKSVLEDHHPGRCHIETVDILESPEKAYANDIIATPTLLKKSPEPTRRIIGDFSQTSKVLTGLGIFPKESTL